MPVIIISSDSYEKGRQIAEATAKSVGYEVVDLEILGPVAARYGIQEANLRKALDESPSLLGISSKSQSLYLAYIEEATLSRLSGDNVVCHGLGAHLYILGVSHVFKVRILADPQELHRQLAIEKGVFSERAPKILKRQESRRKRWSLRAYGEDETDPSLYDMVIRLSLIDPDEAVKTIAETISHGRFKTMTYSVKCMKDKELASKVRAALLGHFPDLRVRADGSTVVVETKGLRREKRKREEAIKTLAGTIHGVNHVEVRVVNDIFRQAAESFR